MQCCLNYIVIHDEGNPDQISKDLNALSKHYFGDHQCYNPGTFDIHCSIRWCLFLGSPNSVFISFPQGKSLSIPSQYKSLENVFEGYAQNNIKLSTFGITLANESFNTMVSAKELMYVHCSSSGFLNCRV